MSCVIYYLYGEAIPALMAEAKLKGGGAAIEEHSGRRRG